MTNITMRNMASIGIKLTVICFTVQAIGALANIAITYGAFFDKSDASLFNGTPQSLSILLLCLPFLGLLLLSLLWANSDKIAALMAKDLTPEHQAETSHPVCDLQEILFCAIGMFVFITNLPSQSPYMFVVATLFIKVVLSLILIFNARRLFHLLNKFRFAGVKH